MTTQTQCSEGKETPLQLDGNIQLKKVEGGNPNLLFQMEITPGPVISPKANVQKLSIAKTIEYDFATAGGLYTLRL